MLGGKKPDQRGRTLGLAGQGMTSWPGWVSAVQWKWQRQRRQSSWQLQPPCHFSPAAAATSSAHLAHVAGGLQGEGALRDIHGVGPEDLRNLRHLCACGPGGRVHLQHARRQHAGLPGSQALRQRARWASAQGSAAAADWQQQRRRHTPATASAHTSLLARAPHPPARLPTRSPTLQLTLMSMSSRSTWLSSVMSSTYRTVTNLPICLARLATTPSVPVATPALDKKSDLDQLLESEPVAAPAPLDEPARAEGVTEDAPLLEEKADSELSAKEE